MTARQMIYSNGKIDTVAKFCFRSALGRTPLARGISGHFEGRSQIQAGGALAGQDSSEASSKQPPLPAGCAYGRRPPTPCRPPSLIASGRQERTSQIPTFSPRILVS